jgi:hypothetical protein
MWDADAPQDDGELRAVPGLAGVEHAGQRLAALLDGQVHLGRQPAAGTAQRVVGRLTDRRGGLGLGMSAGAGGVLVGPIDR